jgi:1,4-dihydroxy-2-naphthoyl-CoA hydrolase
MFSFSMYLMPEEITNDFDKLITDSPFAKLMAVEVIEKTKGHVRLRLPFAEHFMQALGRVHGGVIFSLADHASGWAAVTTLTKKQRVATLEMKINYIGAVTNEACIAEAKVVHSGRTSIVVESDVKTESGRLVAKTLATFAVLNPKEDE